MGALDRDYFGGDRRQVANPPMPPVTKTLLIANLAIYFIDMLFLRQAFVSWGCFTVQSAFAEWRLWELVTFQFLHGSVGHVVFNSIGLYFFGPWMERWWGSGRFTAYYLLCGAAGAVFYTLLTLLGILPERGTLPGVLIPLVGASAGIYGLIVGVAFIQPKATVHLLIPPVSLSMRNAALLFIGLAVAVIVGDILVGGALFKNSGGEAGHLGGAILGFVLMKFPFLLRKGSRPRKIIRPPEFRRKAPPKLRPRSEVDLQTANEVDRVLDKISREGLQSLTEAERKILHEAARAYDEP
jgi:membrane associated rhomboid family serine protease